MVKVGNDGDVPGATGQGACEEATPVIDEVGDDHFKDLWGSLVTGDEDVTGTPGGARPEHVLWIPARLLYQTRIASNLITGVNV